MLNNAKQTFFIPFQPFSKWAQLNDRPAQRLVSEVLWPISLIDFHEVIWSMSILTGPRATSRWPFSRSVPLGTDGTKDDWWFWTRNRSCDPFLQEKGFEVTAGYDFWLSHPFLSGSFPTILLRLDSIPVFPPRLLLIFAHHHFIIFVETHLQFSHCWCWLNLHFCCIKHPICIWMAAEPVHPNQGCSQHPLVQGGNLAKYSRKVVLPFPLVARIYWYLPWAGDGWGIPKIILPVHGGLWW